MPQLCYYWSRNINSENKIILDVRYRCSMPSLPENNKQFEGFSIPEQNWFRMPNDWTNITAGMKSLAELKVVEYVLRHTWGYHEYGIAKRISINEFMEGRKRKDGSRIDRGTGLSKQSVVDGLRNAVTRGYLVEHKDDRDRGRIQKSYSLRIKNLDPDVKNLDRGVKNLDTWGQESRPRSEKETSERNLTVNGNQATSSPVLQLPDLDQPELQTEMIAEEILDRLGDTQSASFYRRVAAKVAYNVIDQALSEIRTDGANEPPKVFTFRMNQYALRALRDLR